MKENVLILDLDGVLITTPPWKADEMDSDGYSKFNESCLTNLNELLTLYDFDIWLSSTRRTLKTIEEFNLIFKFRNIKKPIKGYLPIYPWCKNRKEEILTFIDEFEISNYLIIDDDKSLNGLEQNYKDNLILTDLMKGFDRDKLKSANENLIKRS